MLYIRHMIRTQIYLDEDQAQDIIMLAKSQKKEKAKVIRALIQKGLEQEKNKQSVGDTLLEFANLGKKLKLKGPKDVSLNHDQYLYNE
jgi:hypothetical protein